MGSRLNVIQLYGNNKPPGSQLVERVGESLAVGTTSRAFEAPDSPGRWGYQAVCSGTFTASMTVWYSMLSQPDPNNDADWVQDLSLGTSGTITLAAGTSGLPGVGNVVATYIRFKVVVATGTLVLALRAASETIVL